MNYSIDPINREVLIKFQPSIADLNGKWCRSAIVQLFQTLSNNNGHIIEFDCNECREVYTENEHAVYATLSYDAVSTLQMPPMVRLEQVLRLYGATELDVSHNQSTGNVEALIKSHNFDMDNLPSDQITEALSWLDLNLSLFWRVKGTVHWLRVEAAPRNLRG